MMATKTKIVYKLEQLPEIVARLFPLIKNHKILALHGELGAGKTTFTAALCKFLQIKETADSPTFSLINQYSFIDENEKEQTVYHTDWYRLKDEEEARMAGIEDMLSSRYFLCIIEWSENAPELIPAHTLHLRFETGETVNERILRVENEAHP